MSLIPAISSTSAMLTRWVGLRLDAFPDGGLARLRLIGDVDVRARRHAGLRFFNALPPTQALCILTKLGLATRAARTSWAGARSPLTRARGSRCPPRCSKGVPVAERQAIHPVTAAVEGERLIQLVRSLAEFGALPGGMRVDRQALTPDDLAARRFHRRARQGGWGRGLPG